MVFPGNQWDGVTGSDLMGTLWFGEIKMLLESCFSATKIWLVTLDSRHLQANLETLKVF